MAATKKIVTSVSDRGLAWLLLIAGIVGFAASFIITDEKFKLLQNPNYHPVCSINPVISCGSVMSSHQAAVFGFLNSYIALAAFAALATIGVTMLAGAKFARWFWIGVELGTVFGIAMVHFLFFQSVYRIHALCPFCMVVWVVTILSFWYVTLYNLREKNIVLPKRLAAVNPYLQRHHADIVVLWFLIIAGLILKHFWYFFGKNL